MPDTARRSSPVFLVSAPYSGAGALGTMLASHPDIVFASCLDFLIDAIRPDGRFMKRDPFLRAIKADPGFTQLGLSIPEGRSFVEIANGLLDQVANGKPGAAITVLSLHRHFDRILWLWPQARFIHLVRDGREVAQAVVQAKAAGDLWHGIAYWVQIETLWERMARKLPAEHQITIHHEALAADTGQVLRRLWDFLALPSRPVSPDQASLLPPAGAGEWRRSPPAELSAAEHRAARWLLQHGYVLSGTVRTPPLFRRMAFGLSNRLIIANHRRTLLGTGRWLRKGLEDVFRSRSASELTARRERQMLDPKD